MDKKDRLQYNVGRISYVLENNANIDKNSYKYANIESLLIILYSFSKGSNPKLEQLTIKSAETIAEGFRSSTGDINDKIYNVTCNFLSVMLFHYYEVYFDFSKKAEICWQ